MIYIDNLKIKKITKNNELTNKKEIIDFLYKYLDKYTDKKDAIEECINYSLSENPNKGGFILISLYNNQLAGVAVINNTGMTNYIPENILVYIAVNSNLRGLGIGSKMIIKIIEECKGDIKLHVDFGNPAQKLYEKFGFEKKYYEMRLKKNG